MLSEFHTISGMYSPEASSVALDYRSLYQDPLSIQLTLIHELEHHVLSKTTDYGLATGTFAEIKNIASSVNKEYLENCLRIMVKAQLTTQESAASFIEMMDLKDQRGKTEVEKFVTERMPDEYKVRFTRLAEIFESSYKYKNAFLSKVPLLAMSNGIRTRILGSGFANLEELITFLDNDAETPDYRFEKLRVGVIKNKAILNRSGEEICKVCGINYYGPTPKEDVMNFINRLLEYTNHPDRLSITDIHDPLSLEEVASETESNLLITNLNINLSSAEFLNKQEDLLFYKDTIKTIMLMGVEGLVDQEKIEFLFKRRFESGLVVFTKQSGKFLYSSDYAEIKSLIENELSSIPIITKWGVYKPNSKISLFDTNRLPNVVIYNTAQVLIDSFSNIVPKNKFYYLDVASHLKSTLRILFIIDDNNVVHALNTLSKSVEDIKNRFESILEPANVSNLGEHKDSINNFLNIWNGLESDYDWFSSIKNVV